VCEDCCGAAAKRSVSTKCTGAFVLCEQCRLLLKADGKTFVLLVSLAVAGGPTSTLLIGRAMGRLVALPAYTIAMYPAVAASNLILLHTVLQQRGCRCRTGCTSWRTMASAHVLFVSRLGWKRRLLFNVFSAAQQLQLLAGGCVWCEDGNSGGHVDGARPQR
jgi:hypothetical protein